MLPFEGLTFCCTAIPLDERQILAKKIEEMGGVHYSDLMSDVKYVIVGERNTEKYKYCVQNRYDVRFLRPQVIENAHLEWNRNPENSISLDGCTMKPFDGISICLSRIGNFKDLMGALFRTSFSKEDLTTMRLHKLIEENGGIVTESLLMANSCVVTTEKAGKRYGKAVEWNIPTVHPIWIVDSILRNAALDFSDYSLDSSLNGCNVWHECLNYSKSKIKKNPRIWNEIMNAKVDRKSTSNKNAWDDADDESTNTYGDIVSDSTSKSTSHIIRANNVQDVQDDEKKSELFLGLCFKTVGFTDRETKILESIIQSHGGEFAEHSCITHLIFPVTLGPQTTHLLKALDPAIKYDIKSGKITVVTDWFVERSIYYNKIMQDRWSFPFRGLKPSISKLKVCITGFTGIELLHIEKLVSLLNFEFCPTLTSSRDLLLVNISLFRESLIKDSPELFLYKANDIISCPTYLTGSTSVSQISSKNKIMAARKWAIPIVSVAYLYECLECSLHSSSQNLILADLRDPQWCVFAPRRARKLTSENDLAQVGKSNNSSRLEDLQVSPRKIKKRRTFGRLAGKASGETIAAKLRKTAEETKADDVSFDEDMCTQVGYEDADSLIKKKQLLQKLSKHLPDTTSNIIT